MAGSFPVASLVTLQIPLPLKKSQFSGLLPKFAIKWQPIAGIWEVFVRSAALPVFKMHIRFGEA